MPHAGAGARQGENQPCQRGDHSTEAKIAKRRDGVTFAPGEAQGTVLHMEVTHRRHAGGHEKDEDKCTPTEPVVTAFAALWPPRFSASWLVAMKLFAPDLASVFACFLAFASSRPCNLSVSLSCRSEVVLLYKCPIVVHSITRLLLCLSCRAICICEPC